MKSVQIIRSNLAKYRSKNPFKKILLTRFLEAIFRAVVSINPKLILDAGCGEGLPMKYFKQKNTKLSFVGIDIDKRVLSIAKNNVKTERFVLMDVTKMRYKNNYYDLVLMLEVLEHLENPEAAIVEVKRVSKNWCIFSVPNEPWFSFLSFLSGMHLRRLGRHPEHIHFWSSQTFTKLIKQYFRHVDVVRSLPWTIVVARKS